MPTATSRLERRPSTAPEDAAAGAPTTTSRPVACFAVTSSRAFCSRYLQLPNYANTLLRQGFTPEDIANGGSDRLIDAIVAQGSLEAVIARVQAHLDAGADHVCVQLRSPDAADLAVGAYGELFAALGGLR